MSEQSATDPQVPSTIWRTLAARTTGEQLPKGLDAAWDIAAGYVNRANPRARRFLTRAARIVAMESKYGDLSDANLREQAHEFRDMFRCGREKPANVEAAFALVREVATRQLGQRPFLVQIAGALALEAGCITEMATGEGKTLTATMPSAIAGWRGRGCHVITTNDYLAKRDAEWMTPIFNFCGLKTAYIDQEMQPAQRKQAYLADITYCTNKEVTADFLRDRLALGRLRGLPSALLAHIADGVGSGTDRLVQRGLYYAIVDEADSVLIDEAVTPLIISGDAPNAEQVEAFQQAAELVEPLEEGRDFRVNQRYREVDLTQAGKNRLEELAAQMGGIWRGARRREELAVQALTASHFYIRDKQYIVDTTGEHQSKRPAGSGPQSNIVIVDEFTGRLMPDRTWRDGLHQAIEAKELVTVNPPKDTYARVSFQRFFRLYRKLGGMTGTASEAWREFWQIYRRPVVVIPTNRPCIRRREGDRVYTTEVAKWKAIVEETRVAHEKGRPVLIGTRSVRASDLLSNMLREKGMEHEVINAVRHAEEAQVVNGAGQPGRITVATNMAGRGTDIKLGRGVAESGGLHVIASERHEAGRIDRQLYGRSARQGDPGSALAIVSLEDELVQRYTPWLRGVIARRYGHGDAEIRASAARRLFDMAQARAERLALRQRKGVLRTDDWLDEYLGFAGSER